MSLGKKKNLINRYLENTDKNKINIPSKGSDL